MRICGIDPGTRVVGFGVVDDQDGRVRLVEAGIATARASRPLAERLVSIRDQLDAALERSRPDVVIVERAFFGENPQSLIAMGEGRGIALVCAHDCGATLFEYSPAEIKKAVTGNGGATKARVAAMVAVLLGRKLDELAADATDALAAALCHAQRRHLLRVSATAAATPEVAALLAQAQGSRRRRGRGR
ncbi:MAG: crossover junction endodeoxyribonuclease RuvC [Planctomycetes bacterium]|nr:crossover junction endodeoxyribonuclease RuvC [Planctomycetota bacterium]